MTETNNDAFASGNRSEIRKAVWYQLLRGAVVGGTVAFGPIIFIYVIYLVGLLLPPESKEADDPTPDSFVQQS
ncbi:MAG: RC-LH1 core complex protein PufX [Pseudomonadota bacterium]